MDKKDMTLLIEAEDAINDMDRLLVQLTSMGHSDGLFNKIDNVYEVIMNNSHEYYQKAKKENNFKHGGAGKFSLRCGYCRHCDTHRGCGGNGCGFQKQPLAWKERGSVSSK